MGNPAEMHRRRLAESFYTAHCPWGMAEIDYIDFHYPVRIVSIPAGARLWGFKDPRVSPLHSRNTFFTVPGTPVEILGVHGAGNLHTNRKVCPKVLNEYLVVKAIPAALESVCRDGIDRWSIKDSRLSVPVQGGGWQYKVPNASHYLTYTSEFPQRR